MSWIDDPWMGFDTETTGVRALKDRLVTAALVLRIDGASYRSGVSAPDQVATWLTDPGIEIPEQATAVHGITTEQARRDGRPIEQVLELVRQGVGAITAAPDVLAALIKNPATDAAIADQNRDFGILVGERRTWLDLINDK